MPYLTKGGGDGCLHHGGGGGGGGRLEMDMDCNQNTLIIVESLNRGPFSEVFTLRRLKLY